METIKYQDEIMGIIIRTLPEGSIPLSAPTEPLQIVTLKHKKGVHLKAHRHLPTDRRTERMQEFIMVKHGRVRIGLYSEGGQRFQDIELQTGEGFLSMRGGISFDVLEDTEVIEVKNGPFMEDKELI